MLKRFELPPTVHHHAHYRVWNRRGYDMNIWSEKKRNQKIDYMHNNPVKRGLVAHPGDWPWSSWRFYYLEDSSILAMDRLP
jgi:putative transposase